MHTFGILIIAVWAIALVTTIVNFATIRRLRKPETPPSTRISVVIPARNEERTIEAMVRAMLAQTVPNLEVIVVNDRSTDSTLDIFRRLEDPRLVIVDGEEPPPGWLGKPWAIDQGSRHATGALLLIVDADVLYAPDALAAAAVYLESAGVDLVNLFPRFEMHGFWEHAAVMQLPLTAFVFIPVWLSNRTHIAALGIGGGPGNLIRRDVFTEIGGYSVVCDAVVDDVGFVRQVRSRGYSSHVVLADEQVSIRMYHGLREVIDGFTKNTYIAFGGTYLRSVIVVVAMIAFHLVPFVLAIALRPAGIAAVGLITSVRVILFARLRYPILWALLQHPFTTVTWIWIVLRSTWQTGFRRQIHWRGRKTEAWSRFGR